MYAVRPQGMARIGDTYWPDGIPQGSSHPAHNDHFIDSVGAGFSICYTADQIHLQLLRWGFFSPFIPLTVSGDI